MSSALWGSFLNKKIYMVCFMYCKIHIYKLAKFSMLKFTPRNLGTYGEDCGATFVKVIGRHTEEVSQ